MEMVWSLKETEFKLERSNYTIIHGNWPDAINFDWLLFDGSQQKDVA